MNRSGEPISKGILEERMNKNEAKLQKWIKNNSNVLAVSGGVEIIIGASLMPVISMFMFSEVELPSNRKFGFFFTAVFVLLGLYALFEDSINLSSLFFILAVLFLIITILQPELLLPLNRLWIKFGLLLEFHHV